jgi:hypothetical protein
VTGKKSDKPAAPEGEPVAAEGEEEKREMTDEELAKRSVVQH